MTPGIDIDGALCDEALLGAALGASGSWSTWFAILRAAFGLPLDAAQMATFKAVAGGRAPPMQRIRELWCIAGRRSGKSRIAAAIAIFLAIFVKHRLAAGERGLVLILAGSQEQARIVFSYCLAFLQSSPVLRQEIVDVTRSEIRLRNGITIAVHSNSFRTVRGRTLCAVVFDEVAMWRDELSATPDVEVYSAVLPALLTTRGMLIGISTGYRRAGLLYQKHRDFFGTNSPDTLVVQGSTLQFNQSLTEADIAAQIAADPAAAKSEWNGGFRNDVSTFLDDALIDAAIEHGRPLELPPRDGIYYQMGVDASGLAAGGDAYSVAIAHKEGSIKDDERFVVDVVRGVAGKGNPAEVTKSYAALAREYRISSVTGDYYAAEWCAAAWRDCGIAYTRSDLPKSAIYLETAPLFARGLVRLPDHAGLVRELRLLERRTQRGGKDVVDHGRGGRDDHANSVCAVLRNLSNGSALDYSGWCDRVTAADPHATDGWQALRTSLYLQSGGLYRLF